jgi:hypothetical protein
MSLTDTIDTTTHFGTTKLFDTYTTHLMEQMEKNPGMFLGMLVWYTVPESVWVHYDDFAKHAMTLNAPVAKLKAPKPNDVFLRGCTSIEGQYRKVATGTPDVYANYLIRKAGSDSDWVCKQIVRELVDQDEHQISFEVLGDLRFHKQTFEIEAHMAFGADDEVFPTMVGDIKTYFKDKEFLLTAYTIREGFRHALEGPLLGLSVRSAGGIYFVSETQLVSLAALEGLANELPGVRFHIMPLWDDEKQREMVKEAFEDDSVGELEKLMGEMTEVISKKGKLTIKQLESFQARFTEHRNRTKEYSGVLTDNLEKSQATLDLCKMAIKTAFEQLGDE